MARAKIAIVRRCSPTDWFGATVALTVLVWLLAAPPAAGKIFEPTRKDDPVPNGCKPNNCSLREAVVAANRHVDADTIRLEKGRYRLSIPDGSFDGAETGELGLYAKAKVIGRGPDRTIVDGQGVDGVFGLIGLDPHTLREMTITGGVATDGTGDPADGGGVYLSYPKATLKRVVIEGNSAVSGGGIYSQSTNLKITQSTIDSNTASSYGGGIFSPASLVSALTKVRASTVSDNNASVGGGAAVDGFEPPGSGLQKPTLDALNSTFAGNEATVSGGGISAIVGATAILDNTSVGFNRADTDNTGGGFGGGIYQSTSAVFQVNDSVLASNSAGSSGGDPQCSGDFTGSGNALNAIVGCDDFPGPGNRTIASEIAMALADNGGPTETMRLPSFSGAVGWANTCPGRDQRGRQRPAGCDSGAFEQAPLGH